MSSQNCINLSFYPHLMTSRGVCDNPATSKKPKNILYLIKFINIYKGANDILTGRQTNAEPKPLILETCSSVWCKVD